MKTFVFRKVIIFFVREINIRLIGEVALLNFVGIGENIFVFVFRRNGNGRE